MKLPMVPPTNPPVYVGPLRTRFLFGQFDGADHKSRAMWTDGRPSTVDVTDLAAELGAHSGSPPAVLDSH
jgi:hypothetical protein